MNTSGHSGNNKKNTVLSERPVDINNWIRDHVRQWMLEIKVDKEDADILYNQRINGAGLLLLEETDLKKEGISLNARKLIIKKIGLLKKQPPCSKPYPFNRFNVGYRYRENSILDVTETGPKDLIQPCHEFKSFTNTPEENRISKFTYEVIRFAAACMNSRTNGTIHFGVADKPHGQILGVSVQNTDDFDQKQSNAIEKHFTLERYVKMAKRCIKPPRFVEVLKADMTSAGKYVIEVDIEPSFIVCQEFHFNTSNVAKNEDEMQKPNGAEKKQKCDKSFFIRDGSNTKNIMSTDFSKMYKKYINDMPNLSQLRKDAEEKHLSVVKNSVQGSKLCEMITGGTQSMDRSHFTSYILVANKSHPVQLENLEFIRHMNLMAVLDFDPESAESGLKKMLGERKINVHLPAQYKVTGAVQDVAKSLDLTKNTSWVFCNGRIHEENPSDADHWLIEKGSSVRDVVSFLCRKDVLPRKKLLTIFLLLSQVSDAKDPLLETFSMFLQELKGGNQILCISDNETTYTYWKDLINGRYGVDISTRCIYELSFAEVNGTVLSLWSENRKSSRFLPCGGGSKVELSKETEQSLDMLSILCVNQCDGGNEDKRLHEENFYKGGKVSWWNFYYSEQPGSMPFIKRDKLEYIISTIIPDIQNQNSSCEFFNIFHLPGCGGTTLAMHVLWTLKDEFRCAVLKDTTDDYTTVAEQVVHLLTYETEEQATRLPVLLMIDDFQDTCDVKKLQDQIEGCLKKCSKSPQVIIVSCERVESFELAEKPDDTVFIGNILSVKEKKQIEEKLKEIEMTYENAKEFHGIKNLHANFSSKYIQGVVKKSLRGFDFQHKHAQLFAILVLLHVYCNKASLSVSTCEEFLGLQTEADSESCKVEDGFEMFFSLLTRCIIASKVTFEGMRVIHSSIAQHRLEELSTSYGVSKAAITNLLLTTDSFYENALGEHKLMQDVHNMLVKRQYSAEVEDTLFSPLIQDIMKETPGMEETVLLNAAKCYRKDAVISQLLARYYYIKKQDFTTAMSWAKKAKALSRENSYICDTVSQILVRELKHAVQKDRDDPIKPDSLDRYLTLAESAAEACKDSQQTADKEAKNRLERENDYNTYNTAGHLGELQTADKEAKNRLERENDYNTYNTAGHLGDLHTADKEAKNRLERENDYNTYNTAGHLGELQTAAIVIQILQKTLFNTKLTEVLSGKINIEDLSRENPELKQYFDVLQKHMNFILQLKETMKQHFVFFDNLFDNLVPFSVGKDKQKELTMYTVFMYFQLYIGIFNEKNWSELVNNEHMNRTVKMEMCQCLERNKGDSYPGLQEYLYEKDSSTPEEIIQQYEFILKSHPFLRYCHCTTSQFYCYGKRTTFVSQMKTSYSNGLKPV